MLWDSTLLQTKHHPARQWCIKFSKQSFHLSIFPFFFFSICHSLFVVIVSVSWTTRRAFGTGSSRGGREALISPWPTPLPSVLAQVAVNLLSLH